MSESQGRPRRTGRRVGSAVLATSGLLALTALVAPAPVSAFGTNSFGGSLLRGSAHGGNGQVANGTDAIVKIGAIAKQSLGCNPALGSTGYKEDDDVSSELNFVSSIKVPLPNVGVLLKAQQIRNSGYANATDAYAEVFERSTTHYVSLLDGVVTATTLQETAHTTLDATGTHNAADIVVQDLYVDPDGSGPQQAFAVPPPEPNTTIDLSPLGTLTLNEQYTEPDPNDSTKTVFKANAVHLHVLDYNSFHGDVYVAHVETMLAKQPARISGFAYSSRGTVDPFLASGKQAAVNLPCNGTGGKDKVTTQARALVRGPSGMPTLLDEGTLKNTVNAVISATSPYSKASSSVQALKMFVNTDGLPRIKADVVQTLARTYAGYDRDAYAACLAAPPAGGCQKGFFAGIKSDGSMNLVNLVIDTQAIALPVPPNSRIDLPGLGYVVLNEQRCKDSTQTGATTGCTSIRNGVDTHYDQITVTGIHVFVTVSGNPSGLPVGAEVLVAVAHSDLAF